MHGAGVWGAVGHTSMQCVSCCYVVYGSKGRSRGALVTLVNMEQRARQGSPLTGLDNELMVCSSTRPVGLLNLAF